MVCETYIYLLLSVISVNKIKLVRLQTNDNTKTALNIYFLAANVRDTTKMAWNQHPNEYG